MTIPATVHFLPFMLRQSDGLAGATRSMCTLAGELTKRGRCVVVTLEDDALAEHARSCGIETVSVAPEGQFRGNKLALIARGALAIRREARRIDADLVHAHSATACRFAWPAAATLGLPLVAHQRDNWAPNNFNRGLGLAKHVIAISAWIQQTLSPSLRAKSTVVHNAVVLPPESEVVDPRGRHIGPDRPLRIGYAGRPKPTKGIDLLLDAADSFMDEFPHTELHVWGIPEQRDGNEYSNEMREHLDRLDERFPGRVHVQPFRRDVENFYREMDVVVVPSRFKEPFGRVSIEAMAWGGVAVLADHGGLAEVVEHGVTGMKFEPESSGRLLECIRQLAQNDRLRADLAQAGLAHVRATFSAEQHAEQVLEVYRRVLS